MESGSPTRTIWDGCVQRDLAKNLISFAPALLTTQGWIKRGLTQVVAKQFEQNVEIAPPVSTNPRISDVVEMENALPTFDMIIAIGGGSVIDMAKSVACFRALEGDGDKLRDVLYERSSLSSSLKCAPILAVPTTSGSGSEINCQATIWGDGTRKFSISHAALYPKIALLDASLCISMPPAVTLYSGLDALSHAMEAIWSRKSTSESDLKAIKAIRIIRRTLPLVMNAPTSLFLRKEMQRAAIIAGAAISETQTAIAHAISYPLTQKFGLPHGFASSLTLGEIAEFNALIYEDRISAIASAFGSDVNSFSKDYYCWLRSMGIDDYVRGYIKEHDVIDMAEELITSSRASNNLRKISANDARKILLNSLKALFDRD